MDYSYVEIRFLNSALKSEAATDDVIYIKRNETEFLWNFRQGNVQKRESVFLPDGAAVLKNLKTVLNLLKWDDDPYLSMQISAPGYPSVLIDMDDVKDAWDDIVEFLTMVFDNWPLNTNPAHIKQFDDDLANPALDEESESEDEDEEDDDRTDPDMPALAPPDDIRHVTPDPRRRGSQTDDDSDSARVRWMERVRRWREEGRAIPSTYNPLFNAATTPVTSNNIECECGEACGDWAAAGEERQRRDPIVVRRIVNTPNGPRTHLRFV